MLATLHRRIEDAGAQLLRDEFPHGVEADLTGDLGAVREIEEAGADLLAPLRDEGGAALLVSLDELLDDAGEEEDAALGAWLVAQDGEVGRSGEQDAAVDDRKSTRLNSSHPSI